MDRVMAKVSYKSGIERRLDNLRRKHPTHYAQFLTGAAHPRPPAYANEDPNSPWWSSPEARAIYESLNERFIYER